jgi:hypothetical protein
MGDYEIELNILGLRELQSGGILPVKKPFIKFNLKSLLPPDAGSLIENIRTQPQATGANPNINTTIRFSMRLPKEELYCPRLAVKKIV